MGQRWTDLSRDQQIDALLAVLEVSETGVLRFKPRNPDGTPHQRMAVGPTGLSVSDEDPDPLWYASGNAYFGGRVGIQATVGFENAPEAERRSLDFADKRWLTGFPSSLQVENNNIPDQVVAQIWQDDHVDDGLTNYALIVTSADGSRSHSRNVGIRVDAVNDQGEVGAKVTGIELNVFGGDPDNRGIDVSESSDPVNTGFYPPALMTPTQYVTYLYETLLLRDPDPPGLAAWVGALAAGITRDQVKAAFLASPEYKQKHPASA